MSEKKQKVWIRSVTWKCLVCLGEPEFDHKAMMEHLRTVHEIDTKNESATRSTILCLDGAGFYSNTFEYEIRGMKFRMYDHGEKGYAEAEHGPETSDTNR